MFARTALSAVALAALAAASPLTRRDASQCDTGSLHCCNATQEQDTPAGGALLGLLSIPIGSLTGSIGVQCTPITGADVTTGECSAQPVCCDSYQEENLIALGCLPIEL